MLPRVYAVSESEAVAETLAILLERACDYRWIPCAGGDALGALPRPALLIDARAHSRADSLARDALQYWPGVPRLRLDLLLRPDPIAVQRAVAAELGDAYAGARLSDAIRTAVTALHATLKFRLVAARCLLAIVQQRADASRDPVWRALSREQFLAIADQVGEQLEQRPS